MSQALPDKPEILNQAILHLTDGPNLFTMKEEPWKKWRGLFNRGCSSNYMLKLAPAIVKEAEVFCNLLRDQARHGGMFQL
jgi:hypothetical protein